MGSASDSGGYDMGAAGQAPLGVPSPQNWWMPQSQVRTMQSGGTEAPNMGFMQRPLQTYAQRPPITAMGQNWWLPQGQRVPMAPPTPPAATPGPSQEEIDAAMAQANYLSNLSGSG